MELQTGIKGEVEFTVTKEQTAKHLGSGGLYVFATPMLVAMMEKAAWSSVEPYLGEGMGSVGTLMNMTHDAATPIGMKVVCRSELIGIEGRKLKFNVEAFDEKGKIGGGYHERFIVNNEKFQEKTDAKL